MLSIEERLALWIFCPAFGAFIIIVAFTSQKQKHRFLVREALILAVAFTWNIRAVVEYGKPFSEGRTIEGMYCLCASTLADLGILVYRWKAPRVMSVCVAMSCSAIFSRDKVVCFLLSCSYRHHMFLSGQNQGVSHGMNTSMYNDSGAMSFKGRLHLLSTPHQPTYLLLPYAVLFSPSVSLHGHVTTSSGTMLRFSPFPSYHHYLFRFINCSMPSDVRVQWDDCLVRLCLSRWRSDLFLSKTTFVRLRSPV